MNNLSEIQNLIKLQQKDSIIDMLKQHSIQIPQKITEINSESEIKKHELESKSEAYKKSVLRHKQLESELKSKEAEIKKHQMELNQVKTNDAFKALQHEIDNVKSICDNIETEILQCLEQIDIGVKNEKGIHQEIESLSADSRQKIAGLEKEKQESDAKIADMEKERQEIAGKIPPELLAKYDYLRARREGVAICSSAKSAKGVVSCTGCNMQLLPKAALEIDKQGYIFCDNCQRIVYSMLAVNAGV